MGVLQSCSSAREAVTLALLRSFGSAAISIRRRGESVDLRLGTMTPFGPVLRNWEKAEPRFVRRVVEDTVQASDGAVFLYEQQEDAEASVEDDTEVFSLFSRARPQVPTRIDEDGEESATWWSMAPIGNGSEFAVGDILELRAEADGVSTVLRYRSGDGRDGGIHAVLARELTACEQPLVENARARVVSFAYGLAFAEGGGDIRTQLLMLRIPAAVAGAFQDGKLPWQKPEHPCRGSDVLALAVNE